MNQKENIYEKIIAVTNRRLCERPYLEQIERICRKHPKAVLVREKDLQEAEYTGLLMSVSEICTGYGVECIAHTNSRAAASCKILSIHFPLHILKEFPMMADPFKQVGASVHSMEDALEAAASGADYLIAGHVYKTQCKPGAWPRGTEFLKSVCNAVDLPVYAIGGMSGTKECLDNMITCGASGICVMSECMKW